MKTVLQLVCFALISTIPNFGSTQTLNGKPWSVENVDWCITRSGGVRLPYLSGSYCKQAAAKFGFDKNQSDMGQAAVVAICRGENQKAREYIKACQCHQKDHPTIWPNTWTTWNELVSWVSNHPLCTEDLKARACVENNSGVVWKDGKCIPKPADTIKNFNENGSTQPYVSVLRLTCKSNIGTGSVDFAFRGNSCPEALSAAANEANRLRCTQLGPDYIEMSRLKIKTNTCR